MSENYPWIIWELSFENYQWELSSENYHPVYHLSEKLRFIGILAYPKISSKHGRILPFFQKNHYPKLLVAQNCIKKSRNIFNNNINFFVLILIF